MPSHNLFVRATRSQPSRALIIHKLRPTRALDHWRPPIRHRSFFLKRKKRQTPISAGPAIILIGALLVYSLYPADEFKSLRSAAEAHGSDRAGSSDESKTSESSEGAWSALAKRFENLSFPVATDIQWSKIPSKAADLILPEWSKQIPGYLRKLQQELSLAPGSLADEIWQEARDPFVHPEIQHSAQVRVSGELCDEEKEFLLRRRKIMRLALARYLELEHDAIHPDDVPVIALCGSGGGLRACLAGAGSLLASSEDGLFDCATYTSGVSGSCWLQALYLSSLGRGDFNAVIHHLQNRTGVHIAYPPTAFSSLVSAPTNKYLLAGVVEKLKGDPHADFGLVDVYGLLLGARLLVPRGELGVEGQDFKLSNQRAFLNLGQNPLPIYSLVRHEIPDLRAKDSPDHGGAAEAAGERARHEAWFQWFELTPYEFFCEEFSAGIPTWAMGRKFNSGTNVPLEESGTYLPEVRMPMLLGTLGSAFCASLSHYYREIRPLIQGLTGFSALDELISANDEDLSKVHPFDPATLPNFAFGMKDQLPSITPRSIYENEYIQVMDAGMSNNLPIYPLLRPGRGVDVIIAFDASADTKKDNWLSVADGFAQQRGVKGWPVGIGWPKETESVEEATQELEEAHAASTEEAKVKLAKAQASQAAQAIADDQSPPPPSTDSSGSAPGDLGYCTVWVGTTQERAPSTLPPPSRAIDDTTSWRLTEPDAGLAVIYLPFLANAERVPGVNPARDDYMNTFNFVYTREQIDRVVALARANYAESATRIRQTIRAVYERKKRIREGREEQVRREQFRRLVRLGIVDKLGEGDHFS